MAFCPRTPERSTGREGAESSPNKIICRTLSTDAFWLTTDVELGTLVKSDDIEKVLDARALPEGRPRPCVRPA